MNKESMQQSAYANSFFRWCLRVAAVMFMIVSVGGLVWLQYGNHLRTGQTAPSTGMSAITAVTRPGQRTRITLPDSSLALRRNHKGSSPAKR